MGHTLLIDTAWNLRWSTVISKNKIIRSFYATVTSGLEVQQYKEQQLMVKSTGNR